MRIALGKFARSGIEARLGSDLAVGVRTALLYYARQLELGWRPASFPRFREWEPLATGIDVDLQLDPEVQGALRREGLRNGAPLEQVAAHAVLVYLAHLDELSGPKFV